MEAVTAQVLTAELQQRTSTVENQAYHVVANEVRAAKADFEHAEAGRFGELAGRSRVFETELEAANTRVRSLAGELQAHAAVSASVREATRQRDELASTLAAARAEYSREARGFAATIQELRQHFSSRLTPLEGEEETAVQTLESQESRLRDSTRAREGLHELIECERVSVRL